jgi:hypothetical protein
MVVEMQMNKTGKPTAAGVLIIISGCFALLGALFFVVPITALGIIGLTTAIPILLAIAIIPTVTGILAIVGGIFATKRKIWGLALAGSIASVIICPILGIPALVLTALSRYEFD